MDRSDRVRTLGGPGGLRCPCCGFHQRRALVKGARRRAKRDAIREGVADRDADREASDGR
jgi:hypothetical protein